MKENCQIKINFRRVLSDDWKELREIRLMGINSDPQAFGGDLTEEIERKELEWRKRIESSDRFYFIAEESGRFVSMAGAKQISSDIWMLMAVYTMPVFRGRGLAQKVTDRVIDECKKRGARKVELMVNVDQKDAVRVYEKLGFKIIKTSKDEMMIDGKLHDEYVMEININ